MPDQQQPPRSLVVLLGAVTSPPSLAEVLPSDAVTVEPLRRAPEALGDLDRDDWRVVAVVARSHAVLRNALAALESLGATSELVLVVEELPVHRGATLALAEPTVPALTQVTVSRLPGPDGGTITRLRLPSRSRVHRVVATLLTGLRAGRRRITSPGLRVAVGSWQALPWVAGDPSARTPSNAGTSWRSDDPTISPFHLVLDAADAPTAGPDGVLHVDVRHRCPPVDSTIVNPHGFVRSDTAGVLTAVATNGEDGPRVRLVDLAGEHDEVVLPEGLALSWKELRALRARRGVDAGALHHLDAVSYARLVTQLAAAAVPVLLGRPHAAGRELLHPDLLAALQRFDAATLDDDLQREIATVQARRAALRHHDVEAQWRRLRSELGFSSPAAPAVSALVVTKRRAFLGHALRQAAEQDYPDLEVVLGLHGIDLTDDELAELLVGVDRPVTVVRAGSDALYGDLLAEASRRASGQLLAKMDDDDIYGPHHVTDLVQALQWSSATVAGTLTEWVYLAEVDRTVYRPVKTNPEAFGPWVAGGTLLVRREDLEAIGGWAPVPKAVDLMVLHAIRDAGGGIYRTHSLGYMLCRHGTDHTWNKPPEFFLETAAQQWPGLHLNPVLAGSRVAGAYPELLRQILDEERSAPTVAAP